jgi:hypothetical protein
MNMKEIKNGLIPRLMALRRLGKLGKPSVSIPGSGIRLERNKIPSSDPVAMALVQSGLMLAGDWDTVEGF